MNLKMKLKIIINNLKLYKNWFVLNEKEYVEKMMEIKNQFNILNLS